MRKLKLRESKAIAERYAANKWQSQIFNPDLFINPVSFTINITLIRSEDRLAVKGEGITEDKIGNKKP